MGLHAAILHGDAGATHEVAVAALVEHFGEFRPEHGDGAAVAVGRVDAGAPQFEDWPLQVAEAVQAEFLFAVEAPQAAGSLMVEQAGGGDQAPAGQVAHADVAAMNVVVIHVQAQFGAFELGLEFTAEYAEPQGLGFLQGCRADQAFGLQTAFSAVVARASDPSHCVSP